MYQHQPLLLLLILHTHVTFASFTLASFDHGVIVHVSFAVLGHPLRCNLLGCRSRRLPFLVAVGVAVVGRVDRTGGK